MFTDPSMNTVNTTGTSPAAIAIVKDSCFFRIDNQSSVYQTVSLEKFSTLIDQEQAVFNLSVFVGLKHPGNKDRAVMVIHFVGSEGSFELVKSFASQFYLKYFDILLFFIRFRGDQRLFDVSNKFRIDTDSPANKTSGRFVRLWCIQQQRSVLCFRPSPIVYLQKNIVTLLVIVMK